MMKTRIENVVIIEDDELKLGRAVRCLKKIGVNKFTHINNYVMAADLLIDSEVDEIFKGVELIILDMMFYEYPDDCFNGKLSSDAGSKVLYHLAERYYYDDENHDDKKVSVIIYSSENDWMEKLKEVYLPSFSEYSKTFYHRSITKLFLPYNGIHHMYEGMIDRNKPLIESIDFVRGHAHTEQELEKLLNEWANENK